MKKKRNENWKINLDEKHMSSKTLLNKNEHFSMLEYE